jgi:hypothetical protein
MRHGRPIYPSTIPLTHLPSHLPIYHPTYPSTIPLTHLQSHLPIYNPTYPSTIPLAAGAAALDLVLLCTGPRIEGTRCRRVAAACHLAARPARHLEATRRAPRRWSRRLRTPAGFHPAAALAPLRPAVAAGPVFGRSLADTFALRGAPFFVPSASLPFPFRLQIGTARPRSRARAAERPIGSNRRSTRRRCACSRA